MHGMFQTLLEKDYIDTEQSFKWMTYGGLKGETERLLMEAQDQTLNARY